MSHRTLERLFVRLLFDPALVDAMHADPGSVFGALDLDSREREQILAVDRRAWRYDPLRRRRTLRTLVDEFKTSTTLVLAHTRSLASLDAFFSGAEFHACVQERRSIALAFAEFLERLVSRLSPAHAQLSDLLRVETTLARCRRELRAGTATSGSVEPPEAVLRLAPGHAVGEYNANVIETINAVERYLFEVGLMPAVALCDDAPPLGGLPPAVDERLYLLALPSATGVSLMPIDWDYFRLLDQFSAGPLSLGEAETRASEVGISRGDAAVMIESLVEEQVLVSDRSL
jgi:hypothetical protein